MENRHQVFFIITVKKCMNTKVLWYKSNDLKDSAIQDSLDETLCQVTSVKNLSRLHILLSCRTFDAILVSDTFITQHSFSPARHFNQYSRQLNLISYRWAQDGSLQTTQFGVSNPTCEEINSILLSINTPRKEKGHEEIFEKDSLSIKDEILTPVDFEIMLHKKIRNVFETIRVSGSNGTTIQCITEALWDSKSADKKKDIQIYISKLRKLLTEKYNTQYQIILRKKHYVLIDTFASSSTDTEII